MSNKNFCDYCGARAGADCSGYGLAPGEQHINRTKDNLSAVNRALLSACERVLERWDTHDGQMNHVNDVRSAVAAAKAGD